MPLSHLTSEKDLEKRHAFLKFYKYTLTPQCFGKGLEGSFSLLVSGMHSMVEYIKKIVYMAAGVPAKLSECECPRSWATRAVFTLPGIAQAAQLAHQPRQTRPEIPFSSFIDYH